MPLHPENERLILQTLTGLRVSVATEDGSRIELRDGNNTVRIPPDLFPEIFSAMAVARNVIERGDVP